MKLNFQKVTITIIALGTIILAYLLYPNFMGDDTFIHLGFIRDLAEGKGFSFAGNKTYGTTSPLWVMFNACFTSIFNSPEPVVRSLSAFFTFTTICLFYLVLAKANIGKKLIYFAVLSLVLNSFFLRWALSGMEITAAMSSILLIHYLFLQSKFKHRFIFGGFIFGLAMLIRPEVIGFFLIFVVYYFFTSKNERRRLFIAVLIAIVSLFGWSLFSYFYFDTFLPNSYVTKASESLTSFKFEAATRTLKLLVAGNLPEFVLAIASLTALFIFLKRINKPLMDKKNFITTIRGSNVILPLLWVAGFYGYYLLKDVVVLSRYSLILVPFIILIVVSLLNNFNQKHHSKIYLSMLSIYVCSIILGYGIMTFKVVKPASDDFVQGFQTTYREIAEIINKDSEGRKTSVALTDVGIIGLYSGAKVYDFAGLVDANRFKYNTNHDYLIAKKPDYVILREEYSENEILPTIINYYILFQKHLPGFGINHANPRTVTLYKLEW